MGLDKGLVYDVRGTGSIPTSPDGKPSTFIAVLKLVGQDYCVVQDYCGFILAVTTSILNLVRFIKLPAQLASLFEECRSHATG